MSVAFLVESTGPPFDKPGASSYTGYQGRIAPRPSVCLDPDESECWVGRMTAPLPGEINTEDSSRRKAVTASCWGNGRDSIWSEYNSRPAVTYTDVETGRDGDGNHDAPALFVVQFPPTRCPF